TEDRTNAIKERLAHGQKEVSASRAQGPAGGGRKPAPESHSQEAIDAFFRETEGGTAGRTTDERAERAKHPGRPGESGASDNSVVQPVREVKNPEHPEHPREPLQPGRAGRGHEGGGSG